MPTLGLDPGTRKCGYAVVTDAAQPPLALGIVPTNDLHAALAALIAAFPIEIVALGKGTHCDHVAAILDGLGLRHVLVDERETTLLARGRFFRDHPPRGWRRLIPRGLLIPDRPIDDYAALLIAERYLTSR